MVLPYQIAWFWFEPNRRSTIQASGALHRHGWFQSLRCGSALLRPNRRKWLLQRPPSIRAHRRPKPCEGFAAQRSGSSAIPNDLVINDEKRWLCRWRGARGQSLVPGARRLAACLESSEPFRRDGKRVHQARGRQIRRGPGSLRVRPEGGRCKPSASRRWRQRSFAAATVFGSARIRLGHAFGPPPER